jgi:hypothetical protein
MTPALRGGGRTRSPVPAGAPEQPRFRPRRLLLGLLAEEKVENLGEPYTRHLGRKVRELRFHLLAQQTRVTYWLAPGRRIIHLTVFRKTCSAEVAEVARALQAQTCEAEHGPAHDTCDREAS